jgi:hypothetical protein
MVLFTEAKNRLTEAVEKWEPKLAISVFVLFLGGAVLSRYGSGLFEFTNRTAEIIEKVCSAGAAAVGVFGLCGLAMKKFRDPHRFPEHRTVPIHEVYMTTAPDKDKSEAGLVFSTRSGMFGFPKFRFFVPDEEQLEWFVEWSVGDAQIADANPHLPIYRRRLLYKDWYAANQKHFLVMQSKSTFGAVWNAVSLSILLDLPQQTLDALLQKEIGVIDIRKQHLAFMPEERQGKNILYDTLIFDDSFRKQVSDYKVWHSIFHLSQFPTPTPEAPVALFIEPDNDVLKRGFRSKKFGPYKKFELVTTHEIFEFDLSSEGSTPNRQSRTIFQWGLVRDLNLTIPLGCYSPQSLRP